MEKKNETHKKLTYADAVTEIEAILEKIDRQELDIDVLAREVKRATELIQLCKAKLTRAEEDVNRVLEKEKQ